MVTFSVTLCGSRGARHGEFPCGLAGFYVLRLQRVLTSGVNRCLEASEQTLQAEDVDLEEGELADWGPSQIEKLEPQQFAVWVSTAPDPQRTALALFYLNEFSFRDLLAVTELKPVELSKLLGAGRRQFQAWLDTTIPVSQS